MKTLTTLTGNKFQYKDNLNEEIIIYPYDKENRPQVKLALVITPFTIDLIKKAIREKRRTLMGASRDNPPSGSLGYLLQKEHQTPQQLSYLIPILIASGFCDHTKDGKAFVIIYKGGIVDGTETVV